MAWNEVVVIATALEYFAFNPSLVELFLDARKLSGSDKLSGTC